MGTRTGLEGGSRSWCFGQRAVRAGVRTRPAPGDTGNSKGSSPRQTPVAGDALAGSPGPKSAPQGSGAADGDRCLPLGAQTHSKGAGLAFGCCLSVFPGGRSETAQATLGREHSRHGQVGGASPDHGSEPGIWDRGAPATNSPPPHNHAHGVLGKGKQYGGADFPKIHRGP